MSRFWAPDFGLIAGDAHVLPCPIMSYIRFEGSAETGVQTASKYLESLEMVPRAGLEPARPRLWYLRILSPIYQLSIYFESLNNIKFKEKSGPNSGRRLCRMLSVYAHLLRSYRHTKIIINRNAKSSNGLSCFEGKSAWKTQGNRRTEISSPNSMGLIMSIS